MIKLLLVVLSLSIIISTIVPVYAHSLQVTICHNDSTMSVSHHALAGHLGHGDSIGECVVIPEPPVEDTPPVDDTPPDEDITPPEDSPPDDTPIVEVRGNGSGNKHLTAPTSGIEWLTYQQFVTNGLIINGISHNMTDNWSTTIENQYVMVGINNTFSVKTYAQHDGIKIQEIAFGIPEVGYYDKATVLIEVHYNYDHTIKEVKIIQKTNAVIASATSEIQTCNSTTTQLCYVTNYTILFNEPIQSTMAIKAIDFDRRTLMPTYVDGLIIYE